jgi:Tfp pilus assembly protein PilV
MLTTISEFLKKKTTSESGVALAEAMIAAVIILIVLVATALGITSSFSASTSSENLNKANQLINEQISVAKQATFSRLGLATPTSTVGCSTYSAVFNGENVATSSNPFPDISYCQEKQYSGVGITFYVETQVTYVQNGGYDSSSQNPVINGTHYNPKRVTVTVRWSEEADATGTAIVKSTKMSWIKTPSIVDCIPAGLNLGATQPEGCN